MILKWNGRLSKIEELIVKHDERMSAHEERMDVLQRMFENSERSLENVERLLVLEGDRIDRLERVEARQNELFAEISDQLRNLKG